MDDRAQNALIRTHRLNCLNDFYGPLLKEKQRLCIDLYVQEGLTLSEISDRLGMSRQAVSDYLRRIEGQFERFEKQLRLVVAHTHRMQMLDALALHVQTISYDHPVHEIVKKMRQYEVEYPGDHEEGSAFHGTV